MIVSGARWRRSCRWGSPRLAPRCRRVAASRPATSSVKQDPQDFGGVPALGSCGGEDVGGGGAQVGQPHPAQQAVRSSGSGGADRAAFTGVLRAADRSPAAEQVTRGGPGRPREFAERCSRRGRSGQGCGERRRGVRRSWIRSSRRGTRAARRVRGPSYGRPGRGVVSSWIIGRILPRRRCRAGRSRSRRRSTRSPGRRGARRGGPGSSRDPPSSNRPATAARPRASVDTARRRGGRRTRPRGPSSSGPGWRRWRRPRPASARRRRPRARNADLGLVAGPRPRRPAGRCRPGGRGSARRGSRVARGGQPVPGDLGQALSRCGPTITSSSPATRHHTSGADVASGVE